MNPNIKINETEIISDFETKFLDGKKLDEVLKNSNIFIYETWEKFVNKESIKTFDGISDKKVSKVEFEKLIIKRQENGNIFLGTISESDYNLNFFSKDFPLSQSIFDKVAFQVLLFPKGKKIIFNKKIAPFELLEKIAKNYLPKSK